MSTALTITWLAGTIAVTMEDHKDDPYQQQMNINLWWTTINNKIARACMVPAKYLYQSFDEYFKLTAPKAYARVATRSRNDMYSVMRAKDVPPGILRATSTSSYELAWTWADSMREDGAYMCYVGPISDTFAWTIVKTEDLIDRERSETEQAFEAEQAKKAKIPEVALKIESFKIPPMTPENCLRHYTNNQREDVGYRVYLTEEQTATARAEWSKQLKAKAEEKKQETKNTISCESQYDLDDDYFG